MTLKFKDFLNVDYTPGQDDQVSKNAKKRKMDISTSEELETEALSTPERLKRGRQMKKYRTRIEIGKKKAMKRFANQDVLKRRAMKQARAQMAKKIAKGQDKGDLSNQRKADIEKRMEKPEMKARLAKIARRLLPQMRRNEVQRHRGKSSDDNS